MANMLGGALSLVLSVILVTEVIIPTVKNANTTGFTAGELAVYGLISLITIFGLVYGSGSIFGLF